MNPTAGFKPDRPPRGRVRWQAAALALALLFASPGCLDDGAEDPPDGDPPDGEDRYTYEDCDSVTLTFEANDTTWHAARVSCEANVTGTTTQNVACPSPGEAELTAAANLTGGQARVVVRDADDAAAADHRLSDTGGEPRELTVGDGAAGNWTLAGERLEGFEGTFQAELACPE